MAEEDYSPKAGDEDGEDDNDTVDPGKGGDVVRPPSGEARIEGAASCSSPAEEVLRAAREGDVEGVRAMLQQDPALFKVKDEEGRSLLFLACANGQAGVVELLLGFKPGRRLLNHADRHGYRPIHYAAYRGHKQVMAMLTAQARTDCSALGADGRTPLMLAASNGHSEVIDMLLKVDPSSLNAVDRDGCTAFWHAAKQGREGSVVMLKSWKADEALADAEGRLAADVAEAEGHTQVAELARPPRRFSVAAALKRAEDKTAPARSPAHMPGLAAAPAMHPLCLMAAAEQAATLTSPARTGSLAPTTTTTATQHQQQPPSTTTVAAAAAGGPSQPPQPQKPKAGEEEEADATAARRYDRGSSSRSLLSVLSTPTSLTPASTPGTRQPLPQPLQPLQPQPLQQIRRRRRSSVEEAAKRLGSLPGHSAPPRRQTLSISLEVPPALSMTSTTTTSTALGSTLVLASTQELPDNSKSRPSPSTWEGGTQLSGSEGGARASTDSKQEAGGSVGRGSAGGGASKPGGATGAGRRDSLTSTSRRKLSDASADGGATLGRTRRVSGAGQGQGGGRPSAPPMPPHKTVLVAKTTSLALPRRKSEG